ncbi:nitrilase-related carbon-nitrogen hydrolase [Spongiactinospora sp. 9N601]|uniref:nitrilase-related carbon-nitrogen hydrolase n=1 Tax=Spongiactinospora sp. 9N601 TaxID=3375149 RepID=UPI0037B8C126
MLRTDNFAPAAEAPATDPPGARRRKWAVLLAGAAAAVAAVHGQWDLPLAAWLYPIFLLHFGASGRWLPAALGTWAVTSIAALALLVKAGLPVFAPLSGLCLVLGVLHVVPYLLHRFAAARLRGPLLTTLVFPAAVVAVEYALASATSIGTVLSTFAPTQHANLPLVQLASVTGGYGISFVMAWFAAVVAVAWAHRGRWARVRAAVICYAVVLGLVLAGGMLRLGFFATAPETVRVAGVSPARSVNEAAEKPFGTYQSFHEAAQAKPAEVRHGFDAVNNNLLASTEREARAGAEIVSWSEAAAPVLDADRAALLGRIGKVAAESRVYIVAGLWVVTAEAPYSRNESVLLTPEGKVAWTYEKAYPVPGMDTTIPGDGRMPIIDTPHGRVAGVICFDSMFPALMRQGGDADLMFVISNDWPEYGRTHTEKNVLPAVEHGFTVIRQDSNGQSGTIDPYGRGLASVDYFAHDQPSMIAYVPTKGAVTVYDLIGDTFAWLAIAALAVLTGAAARRRR